MAGVLETKEKDEMQYFPCHSLADINKVEPKVELVKVSLFDLLAAFKQVLERTPKETYHKVNLPDITLEQRIEFILDCLKNKEKILLEELFQDNPVRLVAIVTFLAILELAKNKKILVRQRKIFDPIWIYKI